MDKLTHERRSENMRRIRSRDTAPEMIVRRLVFGMGYRYRLHARNLPGKPDLVFPGRKKVVDVRGCFWHQHKGCIDSHIPKSRTEYWIPKFQRNQSRDAVNLQSLKALGFRVLVIWECETRKERRLAAKLERFLGR